MSCNCITGMDEKLATLNTKLCVTFSFSSTGGPSFVLPTLMTEKIERKKRVGPALAIATFCPFCGTRYQSESTA